MFFKEDNGRQFSLNPDVEGRKLEAFCFQWSASDSCFGYFSFQQQLNNFELKDNLLKVMTVLFREISNPDGQFKFFSEKK